MEEEEELEWKEININASNINILFLYFYLKYLAASKTDVFNQNYDRFPFIIFCTCCEIMSTFLWDK